MNLAPKMFVNFSPDRERDERRERERGKKGKRGKGGNPLCREQYFSSKPFGFRESGGTAHPLGSMPSHTF